MTVYQKICQITTREERRRLLWLAIPVCLFALLNVAGVGVIIPFIAVAGDPSLIQKSPIMLSLYQGMNFSQPRQFLIFLGCLCFMFLLFVNGLGALLSYLNARMANDLSGSMATRLFNMYLHQPYEFFLAQHSANLGNRILSMIQTIKMDIIFNGINFVASTAVTIGLILLLMASRLRATLCVIFILSITYAFIYFFIRKSLVKMSDSQASLTQGMFRTVNEAFGSIKVLALLGNQMSYINKFNQLLEENNHHATKLICMQTIPRYLLEGVCFGGVIIMLLHLIISGQTIVQILPTLSMFVYAGYRLMPATQNMLSAFSTCRSKIGILDTVSNDFKTLIHHSNSSKDKTASPELAFNHTICLKHLSYCYPGSHKAVLNKINLDIHVNETIGIIGYTGSGKTTLIDILLGLLFPSDGSVEIDGTKLTSSNIGDWQRKVGYAPQQIYLTDDTITSNIALGVSPNCIDLEQIEKVARIANIHDFIATLPDGYNTIIGEDGVRLSGGQRQRIGIARALYFDPLMLVLDEATSALDNATEKKVMEAVYRLAGKKTIVIIAHRLSTVSHCDKIFMMQNGSIVDQGAYAQLQSRHNLIV